MSPLTAGSRTLPLRLHPLLAPFMLILASCRPPDGPAPAPQPPALSLTPPAIHQKVLDNGLTVLVQEDHTAPVLSVQAWCNAGSITEGDRLGAGLSHILEHMLFKGTERRGNSQIARDIQALGGYTNAYTSFDRTVFHIDLPAAGWKGALDILTDAMFHSTLPVGEYAKEMEVVRREFAMGFDDPRRELGKLLFATAFSVHPYRHPVIGHLELYNQLTRQDAFDYYKRHYVPNNLTFIVVGDVRADDVFAEMERLAGGASRAFLPDVYIPQEPRQLGRREASRPFTTDTTQIYFAFHIPGITHPDLHALDVLAIIAGQGMSSRLHQKLVEDQHLVRSISAFAYTPRDSGLWGIAANLHPNTAVTVPEVEAAVMAELRKFAGAPVAEDELAKARRQSLADHAAGRLTVSGQAAALGQGWFDAHDPLFSDRYLEGISRVTAADVQRVARAYLLDDNLTLVSLYPRDNAATAAAAAAPSAAASGLTVTESPGGIPLVLKPDPKAPLVTLRATLAGGLLLEDPAQAGISELLSRVLQKGTTSRNAATLARDIESLGADLNIESGSNSLSASLTCLSSDLATGAGLLAEVLLHPALDPAEIDKERQKQIADLVLERDQPMAVTRNELKTWLFGSHPYARNPLGSEPSLQRIDAAALRAFHQQLLASPRVILSVAGDFHADQARQLLASTFPAGTFPRSADLPRPPADFHAAGETRTVPTPKQQAIVQIGFPGITVGDPDRVALDLINESLSDLASRLFLRIRERQSLAYFVGSSQAPGLDPGMFLLYAGTRPDTSLKVRDEILDELRLIATGGFSGDEVNRARAKLRGKRLLQDQTAAATAYKTALNLALGLPADYEDCYNQQLDAITPAEVNAVAKARLGGNNFSCVILQPAAPQQTPGATSHESAASRPRP